MPEVRQRAQRASVLDVQQPERVGLGEFRILQYLERSEFVRVHAARLRVPLRERGTTEGRTA